jgi:PAS domain S-box-containing protein
MAHTDSSDIKKPAAGPDTEALAVLETIGVAAVLTGLDGRIRKATGAFLQLGGFEGAQLRNTPLQEIVSGLLINELTDDALRVEVTDCLADAAREMCSLSDLCLVTKRGEMKWVQPHISNVHDENNGFAGRLFVLHDITPIRNARQAAKESDLNYRMLVEQANTVVMHVDINFLVRFINEYGARLFGYSKKELVGRSLLETLIPARDPDGKDLHAAFYEVASAPELHGGFDRQACCADGSWIWIHWSVRAVRNANGDVDGLLCIGTDITRRKHAEIRAEWYLRRSRSLADKLIRTEERERSRIAQYLHDQVLQMLSLANIRMGGVLAGLKNADRTEDADRLADVRHLVEDAIDECRSMMNELVPTLLYEVGLGAALTHLANQEHLADGTSISVDDRLEKQVLPRQLCGLLFQSARELLMNALKYAGPSQITIRIHSDDDRVEVVVSDNGHGFSVNDLEDRPDMDGGGFGLFNIRERLESLGGMLSIESAPDAGTQASISVPFQD